MYRDKTIKLADALKIVLKIWNPFEFFMIGIDYIDESEGDFESYLFSINLFMVSMEIIYCPVYEYQQIFR